MTVRVPLFLYSATPQQSQSPAVNEILPILANVVLVYATVPMAASLSSPCEPAAELLFVVVPIIPLVELNVTDGVVIVPVNVGFAKSDFKLSAVVTKAVVASCVVLVSAAAVGRATK